MDIKVQTPKYDIIDSGCVFIENDYVEFLIDGLLFRLYISIDKKEDNPKSEPYVNCKTEKIDGKDIMIIRAYNWNSQMTLVRTVDLATINGRKLFFRFSSMALKGENGRQDFLVYYSWAYERQNC